MGPESDVELHAKRRLGTVLRGKYRLDRLLGAGGMAVVYKATHRNQAEFAVKMLHPHLSVHASIRERFLREGYAANSVKHPGAVTVVDDDVAEDGAAFLVMELLDGIEVEKLWEGRGRRLSGLEVAAIGCQLLDVLAAAHAKGIIHRDIKPPNLFITRNGAVKVLDFGIARARDAVQSGANATGTGVLLGTPAFMAPEQIVGDSTAVDGRTDLWAAGATLFTLLSGQYVHDAENVGMLMVRAATVPARSILTLAPETPPTVAAVIDAALAFGKESRWPTAEAMRDALAAAAFASYGRAPTDTVLAETLRGLGSGHVVVPPSTPPASAGAPASYPASSPPANVDVFTATQGSDPSAIPYPALPILPRLAGSTTSQPIATDAHPSLPPPTRSGYLVAIVLGVSALGAGIMLDAAYRNHQPGGSSSAEERTSAAAPGTAVPKASASKPATPAASTSPSAAPSATPAASSHPVPANHLATPHPANPLDLPFQ